MIRGYRKLFIAGLGGLIFFLFYTANAGKDGSLFPALRRMPFPQGDTTGKDTTKLKYPIAPVSQDPLSPTKTHSIDLGIPSSVKTGLRLDSSLNNYRVRREVDGVELGDEETIPVEEYLKEDTKNWQQQYFKERSQAQNFAQDNSLIPDIDLGPQILDKILSGGVVDIKPQGSAELIFSYDYNRVENPSWDTRQQKKGQFKFDQNIKLNVNGTISDRINLGINYDTKNTFEFDNRVKLNYEGKEDDIVKNIEFGNVSMPVPGSLISGRQSLFGVKTKLQFGRLFVTNVFSSQKSERKEVTVQGGSQIEEFNVPSVEYDENRHFFLSQYFRDQYNHAMSQLPVLRSQVDVTRVEVWVTNERGQTDNTRNIVGFMDIGEPDPYNEKRGGTVAKSNNKSFPDNQSNTLYQKLKSNPRFRNSRSVSAALTKQNTIDPNVQFANGQDYAQIDNARKLNPSEYTLYNRLGFISLKQTLDNDEVLAVAFEYTLNGNTYQVGEFSRDVGTERNNSKVIFLKLLKNYTIRPDLPTWDLMMKNIYSLGAYQLKKEDFRLQVVYEDDQNGGDLTYLPVSGEPQLTKKQLIQVLNLDRLNSQKEPKPDGRFDYLEGVTVTPRNGRIIFPVLEPFGNYLRTKFKNPESNDANHYVYQTLYDSTQFIAEQDAQHNKFYLRGQYQSSSGKTININAINIPQGSVKVTANGVELQENVDYTVNYTTGSVTILNESLLNSGAVIKVSAESNTMFTSKQKTLLGSRLDYRISQDFNLGGTFMYLRERPSTEKTNLGKEPVANGIYGLDGSYRTNSRFLTRLIDKIPLIDTKEKSEISVNGEFAQILPGHPNIIGKDGNSYLDDFEGSEVPIDLRTGNAWNLASTPAGQPNLIPNAQKVNDLSYNYQRARISWYTIDELFFRNYSYTPDHIRGDAEMRSNHYMREVLIDEVFPNKQVSSNVPRTLNTFDIAFYPTERGPYNFNWRELDDNAKLINPEEKWGGLMRKLEQIDFESANIEYIEFWVMDPFIYDKSRDGGELYINLGNVSEDILKDGLKSYENGMPGDGSLGDEVTQSKWGYVPKVSPVNFSFDNDPGSRKWQDVGLDGLTDQREREYYDTVFLEKIADKYGRNSAIYQKIAADPANDNYNYYLNDSLNQLNATILERYKKYINTQGNSPTPQQTSGRFSSSGSLRPDVEDINNDYTLNQLEQYYQYRVDIKPERMNVGENYIADKHVVSRKLPNGNVDKVTWYQFKIPVRSYNSRVGQIQDFRSIRFMRMFLNGFSDSIILRFGAMNLIRSDWRRYLKNLERPGEEIVTDPIDSTIFDISTVNIEENGKRTPIPYVVPPGIKREKNFSTTELLEENEQSLSLKVCNLGDGDARAAYKNTFQDVRRYKRLKMFVHAEGEDLKEGEIWLFVRLGTDFKNNYYEYAIPLEATQKGSVDPRTIWPAGNEIDLPLQEFNRVKLTHQNVKKSLSEPYTELAKNGKGKITIVGNPDLSNIKTMMIGLKNPTSEFNTFSDNGQPVCGEVWVNELRVSGFDKKGGWAAIGRLTAKLADLGKLTFSANRTTIGFGGLEQNVMERSLEDIRGIDFSSSLQLGKFFPKKSGISIPFYFSQSEKISRPQYNPLNKDILLEESLENAESKDEQETIKTRSEDYVLRRSLNFTNVRKNRQGGGQSKNHLWDIENFSTTYAYTEEYRRNIDIEYDQVKKYRGQLNYNYNFPNKSVRPLRKVSNSKYLRWMTDFNFSYLPQSFSFVTEMNRKIGKLKYRSNDQFNTELLPNYDKDFSWNRRYNFNYSPFRSLRLSFQANTSSRIDEPYGEIDQEAKDSIWENIKRLGRPTLYQQRFNASYNVPLNKFPFLDWINMRTSYDGGYTWKSASLAADSLGNTINNSQNLQFNGTLNLLTLYNKIPFLKTINQRRSNIDRIKKKKLKKLKQEWREKMAKGEATKEDEPTLASVTVNEDLINAGEIVARGLMMVRTFNFNYTKNRGTTLPGFMPDPKFMGQDLESRAPGIPFTFGSQEDIRPKALREGWLTRDTGLNKYYTNTFSENFTAQGDIQPFRNFRINLDFSRRLTKNHREIFRYVPRRDTFRSLSPYESGNFSISFLTFKTAFIQDKKGNRSPVFQKFEDYRKPVADLLSETGRIDTATEYPVGYGPNAQQVLIPAFIAAYTGKDPKSVNLDMMPKIPAPNWRINYNGLSQIDFFQEVASNITLNHAYRSIYSIDQFETSLNYNPEQSPGDLDPGESFEPEILVDRISINEQFSPLIGIDITWKNNWTTRLQYRKTRTLSLSLVNFQVTEVKNTDFVFGIGYRTSELVLPFEINQRKVILENDFDFRLDFTIRDSRNIIRRLDQASPKPVGGINTLSIKPNIEYMLAKNLTGRLFFERTVTKPVISTNYPRSLTKFGFSLRYTLGG